MQIASLINEIRQEVPMAPKMLIEFHLDKKLREFFRLSRCWTQDIDPIALVANTSRYTIAAPAGSTVIGIKSIRRQADDKPLLDTKEGSMNSVSQTWRVEKADPPTRFIPSFDPREFAVYPIPSDPTSGVIVKAVLSISDSATDIPDWMDDFKDDVVAGAIGSMQRLPGGKPWADREESAINEGRFQDAISKARIRAAREGSRAPMSASFMSFEEL